MSTQLSHLLFAALADIGRFYNGHQVCLISASGLATGDVPDNTLDLKWWSLKTDVWVNGVHYNAGLYLVDSRVWRVWKWSHHTNSFQPMIFIGADKDNKPK
jgi:hypothetical protein